MSFGLKEFITEDSESHWYNRSAAVNLHRKGGTLEVAERRMFAKTIIDSDAFLDMPLSAQALYFHLSMRADDDGFVNNPKKIQRLIGASDDDLKLLEFKSFLIPFETGIVVIKHWKIHNYIRGDRKHDTKYPEEMALLTVKENGAYSIRSDLKEISVNCENDTVTARKKAYAESSLPYSFDYKIRQAFWGRKCPICGALMAVTNDDGIRIDCNKPTIQHNIPISKGGKHELGNISVICHKCNVSLRDTETGKLNADEVIAEWDKITHDSRMTGTCQSSDSQVTDMCPTEVRLGKDRIDKDRLGKDSIGYINSSNTNVLDCPTESDKSEGKFIYEKETISWNELKTLGIAPIRGIVAQSKRASLLKARLKQYGSDSFAEIIEAIKESDFLQGKHQGKPWQVTFDWVILPSNYPKVLEGNYKNKKTTTRSQFDDFDIEG